MAEVLVYVANWNYKTFGRTSFRSKAQDLHGDKPIAGRLSELGEAMAKGRLQIEEMASSHPLPRDVAAKIANPAQPLYLFSAPEWLCRKSTGALYGKLKEEGDWEKYLYTKKDRDEYCRAMETLSKPAAQADVLTVAGTVHWAGLRSNPQVAQLATERVDKYAKKFEAKHPPASAKAPEKLAALQRPPTAVYGFNEALVYFNGSLRKTVSKSIDAGDFDMKEISFMPGLGAGTFSVPIGGQALKVGVSICADATRIAEYQKNVDLLVLVSNTVSPKVVTEGTVRPGGLLVYTDGIAWNQIIPGPPLGDASLVELKRAVQLTPEDDEREIGSIQVGRVLVTVGAR